MTSYPTPAAAPMSGLCPNGQTEQAWTDDMRVRKRDGQLEEVAFDKILKRLKTLAAEAVPGGTEGPLQIHVSGLAMKVIEQLVDGIPTSKIDELAAEQCAAMMTRHPDYGVLAGRIVVSNHQKNTAASFVETVRVLQEETSILSDALLDVVQRHGPALDAMIVEQRDYLFDYFGFKTLERGYLLQANGRIVERPQHMWMRVAIGIHGQGSKADSASAEPVDKADSSLRDLDKEADQTSQDAAMLAAIRETYDLMSTKHFTHASPTLFNAGTIRPQLSSCFLVAMEDDSIDGIFRTLADCARISKYSGGIGLHIHNIRAKNSYIRGNNGRTDGIVPMLRVFNNTARYVNQAGKRNGSIAVYLEPWHADVLDFLEMRKNHGDEEQKARDLFYALWVPDLFMHRVQQNGSWSLMCPSDCPGLSDAYGPAFDALYEQYEREGKARKTLPAREVWMAILDAQMETGTPYLLYKDAANQKSNQKNVGTIRSSNLCTEIMQFSSPEETAVCNLASVALPAMVVSDAAASEDATDPKSETADAPTPKMRFDFEKLHHAVRVMTRNLNRVIDITYYPTDKARTSNLRHRPIGIGPQGLADTFLLLNLAFHSEEARELNRQIAETMYHAALTESHALAVRDGPYDTFAGSPASQGLLQFDLWSTTIRSSRYDWAALKAAIQRDGLRNSLLMAPMPTASTSQIMGYNECFEPLTSNLYTRRTLAGEFVVVNQHLVRELMALGHWSEHIKDNIVANKGSVQQLTMLPQHVRDKYKIVWEMPMKHLIDMAADRGPFVCQSQSLNLWMEDPTYSKLTSMHFYAWKAGLKTGIYYLRRKAKHQAQQFTIAPPVRALKVQQGQQGQQEQRQQEEDDAFEHCEACSA